MSFLKKKANIPEPLTQDINRNKLTTNTRSMQRRMNTPLMLKYTWHRTAYITIAFSLFVLLHKAILSIMIKTHKYTWLNYITCIRRANNYDLINMRSVYYISPETIDFLFLPACICLIVGIMMCFAKNLYYKEYVKHEIIKSKKE